MSITSWDDPGPVAASKPKPARKPRPEKPTGPVRDVTRKEIIPGIYGTMLVSDVKNDSVHVRMHMDDIGRRYTAKDLGEMADMLHQMQFALLENVDW